MASPRIEVRVQAEDFDSAEEVSRLTRGRRDIGAVVSFCGICRDEDGKLSALEIEHYPGMAEAEILRIAEEACSRWPVEGLSVIHRHGRISAGENIVLTVAASRHREAAFEAARYVMDFLKSRAPFWKKRILRGGRQGEWVEPSGKDERAVRRRGA